MTTEASRDTAAADGVWHADLPGSQHADHGHGHAGIRHIPAGSLTGETIQTMGMTRFEAISAKTVGSRKLWTGETHVAPQTNSGDHHHGEAETSIYVVSGHPAFVFAEGDREVRIATGPGDFVFVPPWLPHREENPTDEPAVVVISRSNQEGLVVNLPSLFTPVEPSAATDD
jgi:uncharacterized RmlC-like cupin family protein